MLKKISKLNKEILILKNQNDKLLEEHIDEMARKKIEKNQWKLIQNYLKLTKN
ncbi:MAG: hypothetical protein LBJ32_01380 [Oscillospiraceae bacterium]|jgi:hypothetical protein|nr:hypothetical protein [Oscillospiraceae bacterium]